MLSAFFIFLAWVQAPSGQDGALAGPGSRSAGGFLSRRPGRQGARSAWHSRWRPWALCSSSLPREGSCPLPSVLHKGQVLLKPFTPCVWAQEGKAGMQDGRWRPRRWCSVWCLVGRGRQEAGQHIPQSLPLAQRSLSEDKPRCRGERLSSFQAGPGGGQGKKVGAGDRVLRGSPPATEGHRQELPGGLPCRPAAGGEQGSRGQEGWCG